MPKSIINNYQDESIKEIKSDISQIKEHLGVLNKEQGMMKTDVSWLKKFFWIVASASVGSLIVGIFNVLLNK